MAKQTKGKTKKTAEPENDANVNRQKLAAHVARRVELKQAKRAADEEYKDSKTDHDAEIKSRREVDGVDEKEVERLANIRMDEDKARAAASRLNDDLAAYDAMRKFDRDLMSDDDEV